MEFADIQAKGLDKLVAAVGLVPDKLRLHITEVKPGSRSHEAHTHAGIEAFYIFEGHVTVEVEDRKIPLAANQAMVIDATRPHGIFNSGSKPTRYLVILSP